MHRFTRFGSFPLAAFTGLLLIAACSDAGPFQADPIAPEASAAFSAADQQMGHPVHWLGDLSIVDGSSARLTRTNNGASFSLRTTGLEKGDAVTVWWVIWNNPGDCVVANPTLGANCGIPDLFVDFPVDLTPRSDVSVMYGAGNIIGGSGNGGFAGHLRVGETTATHPFFPDSPGLLDPRGAEIHFIVRSHGPAIPGMIPEMLSTFEGGCTPETSAGAGSGPNTCSEPQAAVFATP